MANSIIDTKTDERNFGGMIHENISTTLNLVQTAVGKFGVTYQITYTGRKTGSSSGGPQAVDGNTSFQASDDPPVTVNVSDYSDSGSFISIHVNIKVKIPIVGFKDIFDQTLAGNYSTPGANLKNMFNRIAEISK
ncbi:hypothetical protein QWZ08_19560 [Ferruginibacter paludis]|uniref:hypothetical protein n=1 Tax=Ferruginibacter paludis TaxID=1310417 RepID=UPI0025B5AFA6|nr:hypothetical protein [Ferruginibacter paludis]MDN3657859.1 hypothetical protein [Ferruginibacter paludis]